MAAGRAMCRARAGGPLELAPDFADVLLRAPDLADHGVDLLAQGADLLAR
jgi:hypothetical protein